MARGNDHDMLVNSANGSLEDGPYTGKLDLIKFRRSNGIIFAGETSSKKQRSAAYKLWAQLCSKRQRRENSARQTLRVLDDLVKTVINGVPETPRNADRIQNLSNALFDVRKSMEDHRYQAVSRDALTKLLAALTPLATQVTEIKVGESWKHWANAPSSD